MGSWNQSTSRVARNVLFALFFLTMLPVRSVVAEPVEIKIGATLPLSGSLAFAGEDVRRGIELAIEDFSSASVKFSAHYEDNQHQGAKAATDAQKLLELDKADALISMWDMADVVAPIAERHKIPHLAIRWDPSVAQQYAYTFTVESSYRSYVDSLLRLAKRLGATSVAVLTEEGQGWILAADYLQSSAPAQGLKVTGEERFSSGEADYRGSVLRLLRGKPDMLLLLSNPPHTEAIIQRIRELAPRQQFSGYFEVLQNPGLVDGVPFAAQFEVAPWFFDKFVRRYGAAPKSRAAQAYDIVRLLAMSAAKSRAEPNPQSILAALSRMEPKDAAAGALKSGSGKTIESECVWKVAKDGQFVIWSALPQARG